MDNEKNTRAWFWMGAAAMVLCIFMQLGISMAVMMVHGVIMAWREGLAGAGSDEFYRYFMQNLEEGIGLSLFVYHLSSIAVFGFWYYRVCVLPDKGGIPSGTPNETPSGVGARLTAPMVGWSVLLGVILCVFSTELVAVGQFFFPKLVEDFFETARQSGVGVSMLTMAAVIFFAPIGEELLCRGVIQHYAMKATRHFWLANVFQALLFAIMHMNFVQGAFTFIVGLVLGWMRKRYRSLLVPMIIHFVNNVSTSTWLGSLLGQIPSDLLVNGAVLAVSALVLVAVLARIGDGKIVCGVLPDGKN